MGRRSRYRSPLAAASPSLSWYLPTCLSCSARDPSTASLTLPASLSCTPPKLSLPAELLFETHVALLANHEMIEQLRVKETPSSYQLLSDRQVFR